MTEREPDKLMLSEQERQALNEIEAMLLRDRRLRGAAVGARAHRTPLWAGPLLLAAGATAMVAFFTVSLLLAVAGAAVFAAGIGLAAVQLVPAARSWLGNGMSLENKNGA